MTSVQALLQLLGVVLLYVAAKRRKPALLALSVSYWLQYQLRDILNIAGINANVFFGMDIDSEVYQETLIQVIELNILLVIWMLLDPLQLPNNVCAQKVGNFGKREDELIGWGAVCVLIGSFFYFGGMQDRAEMILQKGSSLIYISSLLAMVYLCHKLDKRAFFVLVLVTLLSTQKLLVLAFLIVFVAQMRSVWRAAGIAFLGGVLLVGAALLREPELSASTLITFLAGTLFGHYESILPLYKVIEIGNQPNPYPFANVLVTPIVELVERQEKFFESFNNFYFSYDGILIAPSVLGFFYYYVGRLAPFVTLVYVVGLVHFVERIFVYLVGVGRAPLLNVAFCLMLFESSPDGLTFFLRIALILFMVKLIKPFISKGGRTNEKNGILI